MSKISALDEQNKKRLVTIDRIPGKCPLCRRTITPEMSDAFYRWDWATQINLQIVFRCPLEDCRNVFIGYYIQKSTDLFLNHLKPQRALKETFPRIITWYSKSFIDLYNQAYCAEQSELPDVAGAGYRKAFEFLIKDYLLTKNLRDEKKYREYFLEGADVDKSILRPKSNKVQKSIKDAFLGTLIEKKIKVTRIREIAKRAAWLGNDATHYQKRWINKDLGDLKTMIHWTVTWIDNDESTRQLIDGMPENTA